MIITVIPIISIHTYRYFFMDGLPSGQEAYKNLLISEKEIIKDWKNLFYRPFFGKSFYFACFSET